MACQLMWNSRNHQLMGLAMTSEDMASLTDIYHILKDPEASQMSYILQFIWRDLTSSYDVVGPYNTSAASVEAKFVVACVFDTITLFQHHGLKIINWSATEDTQILLQLKQVIAAMGPIQSRRMGVTDMRYSHG